MFRSKTPAVMAAAALAGFAFAAATPAMADGGGDAAAPQADIIAVLKPQGLSVRKAGGDQQELVVVRKTGGEPE